MNHSDRYLHCKHNINYHCIIINYNIENGFASKKHCQDCKDFIES